MSNNISIDFEKISAKIQNEIERRNQAILSKNPKTDLKKINDTARIAEIVCITALKTYHEELCEALSLSQSTTHE